MIKEVELAVAGAVGIPVSAYLGTAPFPWWPNMPPYFVHSSLCLALFSFVFSITLLGIGACRYAAEHHICKKILGRWDVMWTVKRLLFAIAAAIGISFVIPLFWVGRSVAQNQSNQPSPIVQSGNCSAQNSPGATINCPPPPASAAPTPNSPDLPKKSKEPENPCLPGTAICVNNGSNNKINNNTCVGVEHCIVENGGNNNEIEGNKSFNSPH